MSRLEVLELLAELIAAREVGHPLRVAIDGVSAAGKTTLAEELAPLIEAPGRPVIRASFDDFGRPAPERYAWGRESLEGYYLDAFDHGALKRLLLEPLGPGGSRRIRTRFFDSYDNGPFEDTEVTADEDAVVLVDGVFLQRPELFDLWDMRVFVDVDRRIAIERGIERDVAWMGLRESVEHRYRVRYVPGETIYLEAVRPKELADVVIENTDPANPMLQIRE